MTSFKPLTKAEEQIMQVLWAIQKGFTHDIINKLPDPKPHYNTVSTILKILKDKGFVDVKMVGKSNLYFPIVAKDAYRKKSMNKFLKNYFNGSFNKMISFFAEEEEISIKDLEEVIKELKNAKKDQL